MTLRRQDFNLTSIWSEFDLSKIITQGLYPPNLDTEDSIQLLETNFKAIDGINMERSGAFAEML